MPKRKIDFSGLTVTERILLAEAIWASVVRDKPSLMAPTAEDWAEMDRRAAEHERDPSTAVSWKTVKAPLEASLKASLRRRRKSRKR